jgi:hypothetical protein
MPLQSEDGMNCIDGDTRSLAAATALLLGNSTYPRPCSGMTSESDQKTCFCQYHQGNGTYVWPFSRQASRKCRDSIKCNNMGSLTVSKSCNEVMDDLDYNGYAECLAPASGTFNCSTGGTIRVGCCSSKITSCMCHWSGLQGSVRHVCR